MADDDPKRDDENGRSGGGPTDKHHEVALAVDALRKDYDSAQGDRAKHDKKTLFWSRITGVGVATYTVLTVAIVVASIYSAYQAKISAVAAQNSVKSANDTETRQLRAYVLFDNGEVILPDQIKVRIKNSGQTPAYNITWWINSEVRNKKNDPIKDLQNRETNLAPSIDLGGTATYERGLRTSVAHSDLDVVGSKDKALYVWGIFKYRDAFQRCQVSAFRTQVVKDAKGSYGLDLLASYASEKCDCNDDPTNPRSNFLANQQNGDAKCSP
jgi:hypothetical protein